MRIAKSFIICSIVVGIFLFSFPLHAQTLEVASNITAVTVFPDRAMISRTIESSVPAGQSTVVVKDLPASLFTASLRVSGSAALPVTIGSLESYYRFSEELVLEKEKQLKAELERLLDRQRGLKDAVAALNIQLEFIRSIGKEMPVRINEEIQRQQMDPAIWKKAWSTVGSGAADTYSAIQEKEIALRDINEKIRKTRQELSQVRTGRRESIEVQIEIEAEKASDVILVLQYQMPGAGWTPLYDARLGTESTELLLTRLGQVQQRTGEDWTDVELTLSTARPAEGAQMPDLDPWFIDFLFPEPQEGYIGKVARKPMLMEMEAVADVAEAAPEPVEQKVAQAVVSEFAAEYRIAGKASVPSDSSPHKFTVAEQKQKLELAVRVVPKVEEKAYLYGMYRNTGDVPLLPGEVNIYRDNTFIGSADLPLLRPDEEYRFSFGQDDRVRVKYRLDTGERSKKGIFNSKRRVERTYITEITSYHEQPIEITVLDQLPVPQDERIEVEMLKQTTEPTKRDVDEKKGVMAWSYTYKKDEKRQLKFGYSVTYPEDEEVPGF